MKSEKGSPMIPLAIVGIGCIFPGAENLTQYWHNIKNGIDSITGIPDTHWKAEDYFNSDQKAPDMTYANRGGFIPSLDFDPMEFAIAPNTLEAIDTSQLLGLVAAKRALEDAGYCNGKEFPSAKTSVILGVTGTQELVIPLGARLGHPHWKKALEESGVDRELADTIMGKIADSYVEWQESSFPGLLGNVVAGRIANYLDLGGTNCVVDAACASSLSALHIAQLELQSGKSDIVLTGGVDTFNDIFMYMCFSKTPALSPTGDVRPFASNCDGTILGEGLGMMVLKRLTDAERDGDRIYAVIKGVGSSSDGKGAAVFAPQSEGQQRAMKEAYRRSGISPRTVELMEAHGTGTRVGDLAEITSINSVYQEASTDRAWCALGSVKSQIGHTKAAAGAAGLIKAALALYYKIIPPTIKVEKPMEELMGEKTPFYINVEKCPWMGKTSHPRRAAVSSFGFGGSNFHCILEESAPVKERIDWDGSVQLMAFSAGTMDELKKSLRAVPGNMSSRELNAFAGESRKRFKPEDRFRLVVAFQKERQSLGKVLEGALSMCEKSGEKKSWCTPEGVYFGSGEKPGLLGVIFPGQGSQYVGMLRDLACQFPSMHETIEEAQRSFAKHRAEAVTGELTEYVYPRSAFDSESIAAQEQRLRDTRVAQPSLGAVGLGAFRVLQHFGLKPDAFAGHSYGELLALCAAGRLSPEELHSISALRGALMAGNSEDRGSMLAVNADGATIEKLLADHGLNVIIANRNAPRQAVLSGPTAEIARAAEVFSSCEIKNTRLPVSAAFHSQLMEQAGAPFAETLGNKEFSRSEVPVFSNTTGLRYPDDPGEARALLAGQLLKPVEFVREITSMYEYGVRTFVEAGPGSKMTGLVKAILGDRRSFDAMAIDASGGHGRGIHDLGKVLAQLAALGYPVDIMRWNPATEQETRDMQKPRPRMVIRLSGANYRKPEKKAAASERPPVKSEPVESRKTAEKTAPREQPVTGLAGQLSPGSPAGQKSLPAAFPSPQKGSLILEALRVTQENMKALQHIQERTALMHQQFLENQEHALRAFQELSLQQQQLFEQSLGLVPSAAPQRPAASIMPSPAEKERDIQPPVAAPAATPEPAPVQAAREASPESARTSAPQQEISRTLIQIVSEKTGYPAEMLEPAMSLDSDLGIDSIKRVEIFSSLKETLPELPPFKTEQMSSMKTLSDIITFISGSLKGHEAPEPPSQAPAAGTGAGKESISALLIGLVSEKTGYPAEMLEPAMSLDSDLGIDSIKRVEIFSALKDALPELPPFRTEQMNSLKTIEEITGFIAQALPAAEALPSGTAPRESARAANMKNVAATLIQIVSEKTGYPAEMLEPAMHMDSDLGIDSIKRVEIFSALKDALPELPPFKTEQMNSLKTLEDIIHALGRSQAESPKEPALAEAQPGKAAGAASASHGKGAPEAHATQGGSADPCEKLERFILTAQKLDSPAKREALSFPEDTEIWIAGPQSPLAEKIRERLSIMKLRPTAVELDDTQTALPSALGALLIIAPEKGTEDFLKRSLLLLKRALPALKKAAAEGEALFATLSRLDGSFGIKGLQKRAEPLGGGLAGLSKTLSHEVPGITCRALDLASDFGSDEDAALAVIDEMFLRSPMEVGISRGQRCTIELAAFQDKPEGGTCALSGGDMVIITGGARGVTAACAEKFIRRFAGTKKPVTLLLGRSSEPTPEPDWLSGLGDEAEIKREIMNHAGGKVTPQFVREEYHRIMAHREIRRTIERLSAAGGQAHYRSVDIRNRAELERVLLQARTSFNAPVRGLIHGAGVLADRLIEEKTGEEFDLVYGTKIGGLLNLLSLLKEDELRLLVLFSSTTARFGRRGQVDYAMANEALNKIAQQQRTIHPSCRVLSVNWGPWDGGMVTPPLKKIFRDEGIGLIPLEEGAEYLAREICSSSGVSGELLVLGTGSTLPAKPVEKSPALERAFERRLTVREYPFLASHVLDGNAVLPVSMIVEWLAHAAIQTNPGLHFKGLDDLKVLKGLKFGSEQNPLIQVFAGKGSKRDDSYFIPVELRSTIEGDLPGLNASAGIVLSESVHREEPVIAKRVLNPYPATIEQIYDTILFHGPVFRGIERIEGWSEEGICGLVKTAPRTHAWITEPLRNTWIADPLVLDCSFQMMILWSFQRYGSLSLPVSIGSYRQFRKFSGSHTGVLIEVTSQAPDRALACMEFLDEKGALVARIENYACIIEPSLKKAFAKNRLDEQVRI